MEKHLDRQGRGLALGMVRKRRQGNVFQLQVLPAGSPKRIMCACKKYLCPCSLCLDDVSSYSEDFVCICDLGGRKAHFYLQPAFMQTCLIAEVADLLVKPDAVLDSLGLTVHL